MRPMPSTPASTPPAPIHPLWMRVSHWLNALAVLILVTSGWRIYDASPLFDFVIPPALTLGGWLGGALQWHFAAMWLLAMTAGLTDAPPVRLRWLRLVLIAGPAVFLVVGIAGLWLGDGFLSYPIAYAKPLILTIEVAMTLTIAVTLGLLLAGAPERSA